MMPSADWNTNAATLDGVSLSPHELLVYVHQSRQLVPLLRQAVTRAYLLHQAREAALAITPGELQKAADRFRHRQGLTTSEQTHRWLAQEGLTVEDFEAGLESDLLVARLKDHWTGPRIAAHFAAHRDRYAQARLRQIVVASEEVARELLAQITEEGRDFAELARQHSLHAPSRLAGGSLGLVPRFALPTAAAKAIFAARAGAIVGPVASDQGPLLYLVEDLSEPALDDTTAALIREELFGDWLKERLQDLRFDLSWLDSP
jgi:parvulin-like peptidyl-prolyl isomerase